MFVMFLASFIVLSVWSAVVNYGWRRTVTNDLTGESFGACGNLDGDDGLWWFLAVVLTAGFPVIMALLKAWKTKDVDDSFAESGWIFALVFVQFQVSFARLTWLIVELASGLTILPITGIDCWNSIGDYSQDSIYRWPISWYGTSVCNFLNFFYCCNYAPQSLGLL
jgi:hypothetical protein